MPLSEDQALEILSEVLPESYRRIRRVRVGIGDDTAVLASSPQDQLWTIDSCEEGTHFLWEWMKPEDVAHKSMQSAMSDVAAMGGRVTGVLCHLTLSPRVTRVWLRRFAEAQAQQCQASGVPLVGGNLSFGSKLAVATTVLGEVKKKEALLRSGAQAGDELWLIGEVGLARAGLLLLQSGRVSNRGPSASCLSAFRRPKARLTEAAQLVRRASSCLDVSDGLSKDARELAQASGVRIIVESELLVATLTAGFVKVAQRLRIDPLETALIGGEDYALLATGPASARPQCAQVIGRVEGGDGAVLERQGTTRLLQGGFIHGRSTPGRKKK